MKNPSLLATLAIAGTAALLFAAPLAAQQKSSVCKDGSTDATVGRGACGHHGGVDSAATAAAAKGAKVAKAATVTCSDGSTSTAGKGACSHHGGVKAASAAAAAAPAAAPKTVAAAPAARRSGAASVEKDDTTAAGAIARCKDGMYAHSAHRAGACGHHGGVAQWMGH